jgi:hypothetical protein
MRVKQVKLLRTGERAAIKKVLQDKRFKNRELHIMKQLEHENVVDLKFFFYSNGAKKDEVYLNLVLEYIPETAYQVAGDTYFTQILPRSPLARVGLLYLNYSRETLQDVLPFAGRNDLLGCVCVRVCVWWWGGESLQSIGHPFDAAPSRKLNFFCCRCSDGHLC